MLLPRVITALVLLPLLLAAIWLLDARGLYAVFGVVALGGAWEWSRMAGFTAPLHRVGYLLFVAALLVAGWSAPQYWSATLLIALVWWVYALYWLLGYPLNFARRKPSTWLLGIAGALIIVPAIIALGWLRSLERGPLWLLHVFFVIFAADTGAYFAGRAFGRRKLLVAVSPGKTVEGALGGVLLALVWTAVYGYFALRLAGGDLAWLMLITVPVVAGSIIGDLTESMIKRAAGLKDSGNLLPGHGGLMDRIDSLLCAAPVMALALLVLPL